MILSHLPGSGFVYSCADVRAPPQEGRAKRVGTSGWEHGDLAPKARSPIRRNIYGCRQALEKSLVSVRVLGCAETRVPEWVGLVGLEPTTKGL
jgi:hypothetical protein